MQESPPLPFTLLRFGPRLRLALSILIMSLWVGLLAGIGEIGVIAVCERTGARVMVDLIRLNRHAGWMIPLSDGSLFGLIGIGLAATALIATRVARRVAGPVIGVLAFGAITLRIPGLHDAAKVVLACGFGFQASRIAIAHAIGFRRLVRVSFPLLLGVLAIFGSREYRRIVREEIDLVDRLPAAKPAAPNVLLIVLDTVRADHMSLNGYERDTTPNLKRLSAAGVRFEEARSTAPWTLPSHASMMTGLWPHQLAADEDHAMRRDCPTLAEHLATQGYVTAGFVGNTYYCNRAFGLARGFSRYEDCPENTQITALEVLSSSSLGRLIRLGGFSLGVGDPPGASRGKAAETLNLAALDWIDQQNSRPFFAFVNYYDAHAPYLLPEGDHKRFGIRPESPQDFQTLRGWHGANKEHVTPRQRALVEDAYDDCIAYLDGQIGRLIENLDDRGLLQNTIVVVTSDHGEHLGEHQLYGHGRSLYRQELRVPLLILAPGEPGGRVVEAPASLRDLPATIADLVEPCRSGPFRGSSLAKCWREPDAPPRPVLSEVLHRPKTASKKPNRPPAWRGPMSALVRGDRAYIRNADGREELYNLATDPEETVDLSSSAHAEAELISLRETLDRIKEAEKPPSVPDIGERPALDR